MLAYNIPILDDFSEWYVFVYLEGNVEHLFI